MRLVLSAPPARFCASAALAFSVWRSFRVFSRSSSSFRRSLSCFVRRPQKVNAKREEEEEEEEDYEEGGEGG